MAAKRLAELGVDVLLVEKRPEVGMPVRCGEATGMKGLRDLGIEVRKGLAAAETRGSRLYSPNGTEVVLASHEPNGYILERRLFDKHLAVLAAKAGAEVRVRTYARGLLKEGGVVRGVRLKHFSEEYDLPCRCVVGADGIEGKVGRWAGINTRTRLAEMTTNVQFEVAGARLEDPGTMEFYFGSKVAPRGYVWVFPKGEDMANVGVGIRGTQGTALAYLRRFLEAHEGLGRGKVVGVVAGGVPVEGPMERSVTDNVLLVGDAARQVDPLTGGGIYNAMYCATLAADVIKVGLEKGDLSAQFLMEYHRRWWAGVGQGLLRSLRVKEALEKMRDEDLDAIARAMRGLQLGDVDIKDVSSVMLSLPPELVSFVQGLMGG